MLPLPRLTTQTPAEMLGDMIREFLDRKANEWEGDANALGDAITPQAALDVANMVAYIRNPANTTYTVPAYTPPPTIPAELPPDPPTEDA